MKKRFLSVLLASTMIVSSVTGCGSSTGTETSNSNSQTVAEVAENVTTATVNVSETVTEVATESLKENKGSTALSVVTEGAKESKDSTATSATDVSSYENYFDTFEMFTDVDVLMYVDGNDVALSESVYGKNMAIEMVSNGEATGGIYILGNMCYVNYNGEWSYSEMTADSADSSPVSMSEDFLLEDVKYSKYVGEETIDGTLCDVVEFLAGEITGNAYIAKDSQELKRFIFDYEEMDVLYKVEIAKRDKDISIPAGVDKSSMVQMKEEDVAMTMFGVILNFAMAIAGEEMPLDGSYSFSVDSEVTFGEDKVTGSDVGNNAQSSDTNMATGETESVVVDVNGYSASGNKYWFSTNEGNRYLCTDDETIKAVCLGRHLCKVRFVYNKVGDDLVVSDYSFIDESGNDIGKLSEEGLLDYFHIPRVGEIIEEDITITSHIAMGFSASGDKEEIYYRFDALNSDGGELEYYYYPSGDESQLDDDLQQGNVLHITYEVVEGFSYKRDKSDVECRIISID